MGSAVWRWIFVVALLLLVQPGTSIRIPEQLSRVPVVLRADEKIDAVMKAFQRLGLVDLSLRRAWQEGSGRGGNDPDSCLGTAGFQKLRCQRLVFERRLADDYQDAQANVNEVLAPLPA